MFVYVMQWLPNILKARSLCHDKNTKHLQNSAGQQNTKESHEQRPFKYFLLLFSKLKLNKTAVELFEK